MQRVISASRRTDIPAFYSTWLINRLRAGYCHVLNPFGGQVYAVSLRPEDCIALVFWTRNPAPLEKHFDELDSSGYPYYFHYTILGYPRSLESHTPALETAIATFKRLADRLSPLRVRWRYDPIVVSSATPVEYHLKQFEHIACALEGYTHHCTFSFVDLYDKTARNLERVRQEAGLEFTAPDLAAQRALALQLADIAQAHGMSLNSCCGDELAIGCIAKNHCVDPGLLRQIVPQALPALKSEPTRRDCGCVSSVDIGVYDTCLFGCTYCYATHGRAAAQARHSAHDPLDTLLWRPKQLAHAELERVAIPLKK